MATDLLIRGLIGGIFVSSFAVLADVLTPKSFAGLFGAAPPAALATLLLTIHDRGATYAALEARSMLAGAVAFGLYALRVGCAVALATAGGDRCWRFVAGLACHGRDALGALLSMTIGVTTRGFRQTWQLLPRYEPALVLTVATMAWATTAYLMWRLRKL